MTRDEAIDRLSEINRKIVLPTCWGAELLVLQNEQRGLEWYLRQFGSDNNSWSFCGHYDVRRSGHGRKGAC